MSIQCDMIATVHNIERLKANTNFLCMQTSEKVKAGISIICMSICLSK